MVRKGLGKSAIYGEGSAPLTVLLTVSYQAGVLVEAVHNSLEDTVADVEGLHLADGLAVLFKIESLLSGNLLDSGVLLKRHKHVGLGI